jgi:hypothetical protein
MTGKKNGAFTRDIDIVKLKQFSKENNCTINDTFTTILSSSLYNYFEKNQHVNPNARDGKIPKFINVGLPFSLRQPAKSI